MNSIPLDDWARSNWPEDKMHYAEAYAAQMRTWRHLAGDLGLPANVVGTHVSKSTMLPVVRFQVAGVTLYLRDNYHDVNIYVGSPRPLDIPIEALYRAISWEDYIEEIRRCRGYTWRGWSDEDMDDPRVLRVKSGERWLEVTGERKDRWARRLTDPAWHGQDWGCQLLPLGTMPGCSFAALSRAFAEGIADLVPASARQPYLPGKNDKTFIVCTWGDATKTACHAIVAAARTSEHA